MKILRLNPKFFLVILCGLAPLAGLAAQVGEVVVDEAKVHQYPQASSQVVSTLHRGDTIPVSNLPTEGFYKTRLANGETAWVSGNDILAGGAKAARPDSEFPPLKRKPPQGRIELLERDEGDAENSEEASRGGSRSTDRVRILAGYGIQNLSFAGLSASFEKVDNLNPGNNLGLEAQFRLSSWLQWAARIDRLAASTPEQSVSSGAKQTITYSNIPAQLGLVITPFASSRLRFSLGAYAGVSISSSVTIHQVGTSTTGDVTYASVDPCGLGALQLSYGIGHHLFIFGEGAYRYQVTASLPPTTTFGPISSFKLNTSGVIGRLGLGFQF